MGIRYREYSSFAQLHSLLPNILWGPTESLMIGSWPPGDGGPGQGTIGPSRWRPALRRRVYT